VTAERLVLVYCVITSILITARDTRADTAGRQRQKQRPTWRPPVRVSQSALAFRD